MILLWRAASPCDDTPFHSTRHCTQLCLAGMVLFYYTRLLRLGASGDKQAPVDNGNGLALRD